MADFGYDVSDYCDIDPTVRDARRLRPPRRRGARAGIRIVLDWVPNHTSDRAPVVPRVALQPRQPEARLVRVARPRAGRRSPERLASAFAAIGPAWTLDEATGQYYLHSFAPSSPT